MNPDKNIEGVQREHKHQHGQRPKLGRIIIIVGIGFIVIAGMLLVAILPILVKLAIEGIYQFENAFATYHFEIANPAIPEEMMFLNITFESDRPSIMTHTTIKSSVVLYPNPIWRAKNNISNNFFPELYVVIFSGSDCRGKSNERFSLSDGTCTVALYKNDDGKYRSNSTLNFKYKSAGDFQVLLATDALFEGNVTRSVDQYIVVSGYETYIANTYAYVAVLVAIVVGIIVGVDVVFRGLTYRSQKSITSTS